MPLTARITLDVPDLPDADVWFANAAAWKNYWRDVGAEVTFDAALNDVYFPITYDSSLEPCHTVMDGIPYDLVTVEMFQSLQARYDALEASYQNLRLTMQEAGFLTEAQ